MHVLKEGKEAFLEFLRNLTPQALLLGIALVSGRNLTLTCCYPENAAQTLAAFGFGGLALLAAWSSSALFIEKYFVAADDMEGISLQLKRDGLVGINYLKELLKHACRRHKILFVEAIFIVFVVEFAIAAVFVVAIANAAGIVRLMK
ncbi:hypothetical protein [Nitrogeniibacter aestuarii]|uniref:hypothetical protein n=1 Tax=Nitrogeniibacter aestuarii TaxID=2815343 RepID=UPI001D126BF7|nr:hypothetical protein [Nitrogeniibacter aestuarii]